MHHAALCMDAEFECGSDKALKQGMSAVGAALELGVELCTQMEVTAGQLYGLHQTAIRAMTLWAPSGVNSLELASA